MSENKYSFNIAWSEEDGEFVATCPAFPGLSALGETEAEALAEAKIALGLFIKTCEARGIPLPEPQVAQDYSGQLRARLPKSLHRQAAQMAEADGISLNQFIVNAVAAKVGAVDAYAQMMKELREHLADRKRENRLLISSLVWSQDQLTTRTRRTVRTETSITETSTNVDHPTALTFVKGN